MKRADCIHLQFFHFIERLLHLYAIFTADIEIITASLTSPIIGVGIIHAELTKTISREQRFHFLHVSHHHFRPMHKRRSDKAERQPTEVKLVTIMNSARALHRDAFVELLHEEKGFFRCQNLRLRIRLTESANRTTMIGLHMLHNQIIGLATFQRSCQFLQPFVGLTRVNRIHYRNLLSSQQITVIAHSFRQFILTFKEVQLGIITTDIRYGFHTDYIFE